MNVGLNFWTEISSPDGLKRSRLTRWTMSLSRFLERAAQRYSFVSDPGRGIYRGFSLTPALREFAGCCLTPTATGMELPERTIFVLFMDGDNALYRYSLTVEFNSKLGFGTAWDPS